MRPDAMASDPEGHYTVLELPPEASAEDITAAFRRAAKRLHPDVPQTGDRVAFLRLQEAYQVLSDPIRRAEYDSANRLAARPGWRQEERELAFVRPVAWRVPRFLGVGLAVVTLLAVAQVGWRLLMAPTPSLRRLENPPLASVPMPAMPARDEPARPDPPALLAGDHFIAPASSPAILWQRTDDRTGYMRAGQLEAFVPVALLRPVAEDGRAEIRAPNGQSGFVDATRLLPGDARAARHAACLYNAGAPPRGGTVLVRPPGGAASAMVENREDRPIVFKLRDAAGAVAGAIYLTPRGQGTIGNLVAGRYRAEFAVGDLWSAGCGMFMAGMRARRLPQPRDLSGVVRFSISAATAADDISDDEFRRE